MLVQKRFRGTQIGRLKPLGESIINLGHKPSCLAAATPRKARFSPPHAFAAAAGKF